MRGSIPTSGRPSRRTSKRSYAAFYVLLERDTALLGSTRCPRTAIAVTDLAPEWAKKLPRYPSVPAVLLGGDRGGPEAALVAKRQDANTNRGVLAAAYTGAGQAIGSSARHLCTGPGCIDQVPRLTQTLAVTLLRRPFAGQPAPDASAPTGA
jgi:hypothetical protein